MNILKVCLGNICRSPVAEGVMRKLLKEHNLENIEVDSCGTSGYHDGEYPDERSQQNALENGTDISTLISRKIVVEDFERFDRIFCMDQSNYNDVKAICPDEAYMDKVDLLLNISFPGENRKVPDPYFGGSEGFQKVYDLINNACSKFINDIVSQK